MAEPNLNVEFSAVTDEKGKFRRLAKLLGLADADHARGKCEHLWLACTRRGETDLPQWLVEEILGEGGPAALVDAELARWAGGRGDSKTRRLRISGARKHCTWLASKSEQSSNAGKSNARTANRVGGKFAPKPTIENHPSDPSSDPVPEDQNSLPHAIPPTLPEPEPTPVPAVSPPAPAREDIAGTQPAIPNPLVTTPAEIRADLARRGEPTLDQLWTELEQARLRAATVRGVAIQLLVAHDVGRRDLSEALVEAARVGRRAELVAQIRHAIAAAEAESRVAPEPGKPDRLQWFTGAIFSPRNFRRLVAAPLPKSRAGPRSTPRDPSPPPKEFPAGERAGPEHFAESRALLAALTSNPDDTPDEKPRRKAAK